MTNDNNPPVAVEMNRAIRIESARVQAPEAVVVYVEPNVSLEGRTIPANRACSSTWQYWSSELCYYGVMWPLSVLLCKPVMSAVLLPCCLLNCLCHFPDDFDHVSTPEEEFLTDVLDQVVCSTNAGPKLMCHHLGRIFCCAKPPPADVALCTTTYCCCHL